MGSTYALNCPILPATLLPCNGYLLLFWSLLKTRSQKWWCKRKCWDGLPFLCHKSWSDITFTWFKNLVEIVHLPLVALLLEAGGAHTVRIIFHVSHSKSKHYISTWVSDFLPLNINVQVAPWHDCREWFHGYKTCLKSWIWGAACGKD